MASYINLLLCQRLTEFWRALEVQPLGDKAKDKYVRLKTETTHGIDSRKRPENMIFIAGKSSL